ncbi:DUF917 domain-containing protein, partial [Pseudonocardia hispaniensis]
GAALMGSGGGGSTRSARSLLRHQLERSGPIRVVSLSELPPDSHAIPVGLVGSVTVFEEKPLNGGEFARAVAAAQRHGGVECAAVLGFEAAGVNALLAAAAAVALGLPLVDADGMGRAFPELEQTTFFLNGAPLTPVAVADAQGAVLVIDGVDGFAAERLTRSAVVTVGGWGLIALGPQRADLLARTAIAHSISRALEVGRLLSARDLPRLLHDNGGRMLFSGKVVDVERSTGTRFARGSAVLESAERLMRLEFQNENLLLLEDGRVLASVPDLICLVSRDQVRPLTTEEIRFGLEADVLTLPGAPQWRTPRGLGLVGPRAFGYDVDYAAPGRRR